MMTTMSTTTRRSFLKSLRKLFSKPKKSDPHTLAAFYYADRDFSRLVDDLQRSKRRGTANISETRELQREVRAAQQTLMDLIAQCVREAVPEGERAARAFRVKYPDEINLDTLNGGLWHSAEILASGQIIVNREVESLTLRSLAKHTLAAIGVVRCALRRQSIDDVTGYSKETKDVLCWFDHNWAEYELQYIDSMCASLSSEQYEKLQECIVLFSESTQRAIKLGYLNQDMIDYYDPMLMFAIPRLAVVCGLVVFPDGPLNLDRKLSEIPICFQFQLGFLARIRELLRCLTSDELTELEKALCSSEGLGTLERDDKGRPTKVKRESSTSQNNGDKESKNPRNAFRDSRDLLHRLFVAVSGVADQLQTNSARDMRLILKGVFAVCDEPVPRQPNDGEAKEEKASPGEEMEEDLYGDDCEDEPPHSPKEETLKQRNKAAGNDEVSERASVQEPPVWLSDETSVGCSDCRVAFTLIRRRHHCRNCGKIFCAPCSSNVASLPHFGYDRPVRVCNQCVKRLI
ncbi:lateral signaling target protein 2 homolog [Oscarella lobularis]|uniref:lateral signaling target protein 2 homolog n=1 Tax=Oscarella lobularis TaxID=121494 RepID=UPI003313AA14